MFKLALLVLLPAVLLAQNNSFNRAVEALFNAIDINNDKRIVLIEAEAYFLSFDVNNDGNVSHPEFDQAIGDRNNLGFRGHEIALYNLFDQDHNNAVTKADIDAVFHKADNNTDNHVSDTEFHAFLHSVSVIIG